MEDGQWVSETVAWGIAHVPLVHELTRARFPSPIHHGHDTARHGTTRHDTPLSLYPNPYLPPVRNFYGFLHSNALQGRTPNPVHALAYMYDSDVIIADIPLGAGKLANWIVGAAIGKYVAGYETHHEIYDKKNYFPEEN